MFLSKIWIFLLSIVAAIALTLALLMPRPAERATLANDKKRLTRACGVADILLRDSARNRIQLAGDFSRAANLDTVLQTASKGEIVSGEVHSNAKTLLQSLEVRGAEALARRLDVTLLDRRGRVVARSGKRAAEYGDSMAGYFLVDDALDGYLRDDLWAEGSSLYLVAGSPVVTRTLEWAGAVIVRELIDKDLADELAGQLDAGVAFYVGGEAVATSDPAAIHKEVLARHAALPAPGEEPDCAAHDPFVVDSGDQSYWVQIARLPGEAGALGAFYAVFAPRVDAIGFMGTIKAVKKDDLSFGNFPWVPVAGLFLLMVVIGIGLTIVEADRPIRRLGSDAVRLAKGETERLDEVKHTGRVGSIARSINIAIDKVHREAKSAKKDLDNLLGPVPTGAAAPLPAAGPLGAGSMPFAPPPPSEFRFSGSNEIDLGIPPPPSSSPQATPRPAPGVAPARPSPQSATQEAVPPPPVTLPPMKKPPIPMAGKTPRPGARTPPSGGVSSLDDDVLGGRSARPTGVISVEDGEHDEDETRVAPGVVEDDADEAYFREVFGEFVAAKKQCGETIENLTFAKFSRKLASNRDSLIAKHGCKTVKFQVYVKDGKAALKASPVRG